MCFPTKGGSWRFYGCFTENRASTCLALLCVSLMSGYRTTFQVFVSIRV